VIDNSEITKEQQLKIVLQHINDKISLV
jgi:hypothetical protein